jgi:hypothetical protein
MLNRRQFNTLASASLGSLLTRKLWAEQARAMASPDKFYFALVADSHIIDDFYVKGSENSVEDNESILLTTPRLISARDLINSLSPAIEQTFLIGDYFHNYPSLDYDFYFQNKTRLDNARTITDGFKMPIHLGFGNHDYDVRRVPREMSHRLFEAKFQAKPYSVLDYKGYRFIHLNNFLGSTQDIKAANFNPGRGSLGEEQLHWFEAQLQQHKPTFVFIHYPLDLDEPTEFADYGLYPLLVRYKDTIYGPKHIVMAATRYDPNAYMLIEVDTKHATWRFMNESLVEWSTHYSKPYQTA